MICFGRFSKFSMLAVWECRADELARLYRRSCINSKTASDGFASTHGLSTHHSDFCRILATFPGFSYLYENYSIIAQNELFEKEIALCWTDRKVNKKTE